MTSKSGEFPINKLLHNGIGCHFDPDLSGEKSLKRSVLEIFQSSRIFINLLESLWDFFEMTGLKGIIGHFFTNI